VPTGIQLVESIFIGKYEKFDVTWNSPRIDPCCFCRSDKRTSM
jgi:hypothetical protein